MSSVLANHDEVSGHERRNAASKASSGHYIPVTYESEPKRRPRSERMLSITGMTLASAIAVGGVQAQSNEQCETNVLEGPFCLEPIEITPFFTPVRDRERVPFYQPDDPRDELSDRNDSGGSDASPGDDESEDEDLMCTSTVTEKNLIHLSETEAFISSEAAFADFVGAVTGGVLGGIIGSFGGLPGAGAGGGIGAAIGVWLSNTLSSNNIHCGDRLITETTICMHPPVLLGLGPYPLSVKAVDTRIEHLHSRCIDDYMLPPGDDSPPGSDFNIQSHFPELRFSFTLNGVTHSFEDEPSKKELQAIKREIRKQRVPRDDLDAFVDKVIASDAFVKGIQAGIIASERYFENAHGTEDLEPEDQ